MKANFKAWTINVSSINLNAKNDLVELEILPEGYLCKINTKFCDYLKFGWEIRVHLQFCNNKHALNAQSNYLSDSCM